MKIKWWESLKKKEWSNDVLCLMKIRGENCPLDLAKGPWLSVVERKGMVEIKISRRVWCKIANCGWESGD